MALFTSQREKRLWLATVLVIAAIFSTLGLAGKWARQWGNTDLGTGLFILGCLMILVAVVTQGLKKSPGKLEIGISLGIAAIYLLVFTRMTIPAERTHLIEYGVVALLIFEALKERYKQPRPLLVIALFAFLITSLIGVLDEYIQLHLPNRVFDPLDILFNALAAFLAIGSSLGLWWVRRRRQND